MTKGGNKVTDYQKTKIGEKIAEVLELKPIKKYNPVRYSTQWGTKTALGIYLVTNRIIKEKITCFK
jgi:hypothetical protein